MNFLVQISGALGTVFCVSCFHYRKQKNILIIKYIADIMWATHYFLLGATSGTIVNAVCAIREIIYIFEKNKKRRYIWLGVFIVINWVLAIITWKGIWNILPVIVTTIGAYSFWQTDVKITRKLALLNAALMFTYDIFVKSYAGLLNESITIISVIIALVRFRKTS